MVVHEGPMEKARTKRAVPELIVEAGRACALELSFMPAEQAAWSARRQVLPLEGASRQYSRVAACVLSQEARLLCSGRLRTKSGYDRSDPWFNDECEGEMLLPGAPLGLVGTGRVATYLQPAAEDGRPTCEKEEEGVESSTLHVVRPLDSPWSILLQRSEFLVLPTRPPRTGDWVVAVGLKGNDAELNGYCGLCGPEGRPPALHDEGLTRETQEGLWFWVTLQPSCSEGAALVAPTSTLLPARHLAALPGPKPGSAALPLEASVAPQEALPPPCQCMVLPPLEHLASDVREHALAIRSTAHRRSSARHQDHVHPKHDHAHRSVRLDRSKGLYWLTLRAVSGHESRFRVSQKEAGSLEACRHIALRCYAHFKELQPRTREDLAAAEQAVDELKLNLLQAAKTAALLRRVSLGGQMGFRGRCRKSWQLRRASPRLAIPGRSSAPFSDELVEPRGS